jgi:uncharacterized protein
MEAERKYKFSWNLLGNLELGRPNLGGYARLEVYRLFQYCIRDVLEQHVGTVETDRIFYEAGKLAGSQFYQYLVSGITDFYEFIQKLQELFKDLGIGVLRTEKADLENNSFVFTVFEDLDCSGLPELDYEICTYDEGFLAGLLEDFTGKPFKVKEIDCWCTGDRTCRFTAELMDRD